MTDLFWPGDERAGSLMSDGSLLDAMVRVEVAWLEALVDTGLAPESAESDLLAAITDDDVQTVARGAEAGGNPVIGLVALLRSRGGPDTAAWLHRGLTSQDVLDTALVLTLRDVLDQLLDELRSQVIALSILAERHAATAMVGRTLGQHAVPTTFGAVVASWLDGIVDAAELVVDARTLLPVQLGGAVGTLAATAELAALSGMTDPPAVAQEVATIAGETLGLRVHRPWHTARVPLTRLADALVTCTDAWGHLATDIATLSRTEIGEIGESGEAHRASPVLAVLLRRAALAAPSLAATMHLAAATTGDQRPDGAWHTEWATLRTLGRRTAVAASQTTELLQGLHVNVERMGVTLDESAEDVLAERRSVADLAGAAFDPEPRTYLGITADIVAGSVERARTFLEENA